jgi:hypothetical protein
MRTVTEAFVKSLKVAVFNEMYGFLQPEEITAPWVSEAAGHRDCVHEAVEDFMTKKWGENRVAADPFDEEANRTAVANGYTLIPARGLTPEQRKNAYDAGALKTAGDLFATPKPFYPGGKPVEFVPESEWTPGMQHFAAYSKWVAKKLYGIDVGVNIVVALSGNTVAAYGSKTLWYALTLGHNWFEGPIRAEQERILIHELAHEKCSNHLDHGYHGALEELAVKFRDLALEAPDDMKFWLRGVVK